MKKILTSLVLLFALQYTVQAQNDIQFSNYMFSEVSYNPAQAGVSSTLDAALIARQQWTGFDQAPQTQLFSISSYCEKISGGLGLSFINDKLGYEKSQNFKIMYAYQARLSDKSKLSFGLGFGIVNRAIEGSKLVYDDMTDQYGIYSDVNKMKPDFDFGIAYNSEKFTLGVSSTHIDQPLKKATVLKVPRHYYLIAKYKIKASEKVNIIPSLKVRSSEFITQYDISALMFYNEKFWIGASYRQNDAIVGLIGVDITKNIRLGYSYDYSSGDINTYSNGSHEIMLLGTFDISKKIIPTKSPRFFN